MGTEFTFTLYARPGVIEPLDLPLLAEEAFRAVEEFEGLVSRWEEQSQITRLNAAPPLEPVRLSPAVFEVVRLCGGLYYQTDGAFDVTVGPLFALWRACREEARVPAPDELNAATGLVGFPKLIIDPAERSVAFPYDGMRLDLDAIAKGAALDRAAEVLRAAGVKRAALSGGLSTVVTVGAPPGQPGWTVSLPNPYNEKASLARVVIADSAFSSSSNHGRSFEVDGVRYGHVFDPRTGWPVEGLLMAGAVAPTGALSDALSTAFLVLGQEGVEAYCRDHPDVRALLAPRAAPDAIEVLRIDNRTRRNSP